MQMINARKEENENLSWLLTDIVFPLDDVECYCSFAAFRMYSKTLSSYTRTQICSKAHLAAKYSFPGYVSHLGTFTVP